MINLMVIEAAPVVIDDATVIVYQPGDYDAPEAHIVEIERQGRGARIEGLAAVLAQPAQAAVSIEEPAKDVAP